jgi:hypothetical protein
MAGFATYQYRKVLKAPRPKETPEGYLIDVGLVANAVVAVLGPGLTIYFSFGP